jgi:hypothetical protein
LVFLFVWAAGAAIGLRPTAELWDENKKENNKTIDLVMALKYTRQVETGKSKAPVKHSVTQAGAWVTKWTGAKMTL